MTSPSLVISTGSFFSGVICEYSSLTVPGATVAGTNSILSISPSSIAAMRTLRAKGEAGEKVSFMEASLRRCLFVIPSCAGIDPAIHDFLVARKTWMPGTSSGHDDLRNDVAAALTPR